MSRLNTPPPASLSDAGRTVWVDVVKVYELRADELLTLEDACAASDMIATLSQMWENEGRPVTTKGSMGQQVIHPLIGEIRTQRAARNALWKQLKLPDEVELSGESGKPNQQRGAAQSRWASHGKGA